MPLPRVSKRSGIGAAIIGLLLAAGGWFLMGPRPLPSSALTPGYRADLANGRTMFVMGNCVACHAGPTAENPDMLGGGKLLSTSFGEFVVPNISSDPAFGIGSWSELEFVNAMKRGVGRNGEHLYPAFPYTSYSFMQTKDVRDLYAYLKTLPGVGGALPAHRLKFPFANRFLIGAWKLLYFRPQEFSYDETRPASWNRGNYLVTGAAHCGECHTPRNALGAPREDLRFSGAPAAEQGGRFAGNITPHADGIGDWSAADIANFLKSGTDKCYNDPSGMAEVIASTSQAVESDLDAMAEYLKSLPAIAGNKAHKSC